MSFENFLNQLPGFRPHKGSELGGEAALNKAISGKSISKEERAAIVRSGLGTYLKDIKRDHREHKQERHPDGK